jgi:hypothetical protein
MSTPANTPPVTPPGNTSGLPPSPPLPPDPGLQWRIKSFDFVADATKQLITVATGVITVTVIFSKDLTAGNRMLALLAWIVLLISVLFGVLTLFNMSGLLAALAVGKDANDASKKPGSSRSGAEEGINEPGNRLLSVIQLGTFVAGLLLVLVFGFFAAQGDGKSDKDKATPQAVTVTCVTSSPPPPPNLDCGKDDSRKKTKRRGAKPRGCPVAATNPLPGTDTCLAP